MSYRAEIYDLSFYHKETPNDKFLISGIEGFCDSLYDAENATLFYVCYQKIKRILNNKDEPLLMRTKEPVSFTLDLNLTLDRLLYGNRKV